MPTCVYFVGKLIEADLKNEEYKVSTMIKSGVLNWKWPNNEDIMWYKKCDIIKKIKSPVQKNTRGVYDVEEMKSYESELY